jgi:hypothetical protein
MNYGSVEREKQKNVLQNKSLWVKEYFNVFLLTDSVSLFKYKLLIKQAVNYASYEKISYTWYISADFQIKQCHIRREFNVKSPYLFYKLSSYLLPLFPPVFLLCSTRYRMIRQRRRRLTPSPTNNKHKESVTNCLLSYSIHFIHPHQHMISAHRTDTLKQKIARSFVTWYTTYIHATY